MKIIFILLLTITTNLIYCQTLYYKIDNHCPPFNYVNMQNIKLDSIRSTSDSTNVYFTWIDNCGLIPKFTLTKVTDDTIKVKLNNLEEGWVACDCEFQIRLDLNKMKSDSFCLTINDSIVKPNLNRYNLNVIQEVYYPGLKLKREIYYKGDKIVVECFYDKKGKLIKERFYNDFTGHFSHENEY